MRAPGVRKVMGPLRAGGRRADGRRAAAAPGSAWAGRRGGRGRGSLPRAVLPRVRTGTRGGRAPAASASGREGAMEPGKFISACNRRPASRPHRARGSRGASHQWRAGGPGFQSRPAWDRPPPPRSPATPRVGAGAAPPPALPARRGAAAPRPALPRPGSGGRRRAQELRGARRPPRRGRGR